MKQWQKYSILTAALAGVAYYLIHQHIVVISINHASYVHAQTTIQATKKKSLLFLYKNETWHQEPTELVWPHDKNEALSYVCNRWLSVATEEELLHKKVTVTHAFISKENQGYISFDQSPFEQDAQSIHEKRVFLEGLIRSIHATDLGITGLYLLVNDKPLEDYHFDFTLAWPIKK